MPNFNELRHRFECILPYWVRTSIRRFFHKIKKHRKNNISAQIAELRNIIIFNNPIHKIPQATGKLRLLQEGNTVLLDVFTRKCEEYGLNYWIDYGTLLGAVRHKGFVPWDDDVDVGMLIEDYKKLLKLSQEMFPKEEGFTVSQSSFLHIGYKGTPLNIDVFPHYVYAKSHSEENKTRLRNLLYQVNKRIVYTKGLLNLTMDQIDTLYQETVLNDSDNSLKSQDSLVFISPAAAMVNIDILQYNDIFPLKEISFEDIKVKAPAHPRRCLETIYGDYMSYPPKVGLWHQNIEEMVKRTPFETDVNTFIDKYSS